MENFKVNYFERNNLTEEFSYYYKAFKLSTLVAFDKWNEISTPEYKMHVPQRDNNTNVHEDSIVEFDKIVYLQENFKVTADIYTCDSTIVENVNKEWIEFCEKTLKFTIPDTVQEIKNLDKELKDTGKQS